MRKPDQTAPELDFVSLLVLADLGAAPTLRRKIERINSLICATAGMNKIIEPGKVHPRPIRALVDAGLIEVRGMVELTDAGEAVHRRLVLTLREQVTHSAN